MSMAFHSRTCRNSTEGGKLTNIAEKNVYEPLPYEWTETEKFVLNVHCTNTNGRVFLFKMSSILATHFSAMCEKSNNKKRGMRGVLVDDFFPSLLSALTKECQDQFDGNGLLFLRERNIRNLDQFINYSEETKAMYGEFVGSVGSPDFVKKIISSARFERHWPNSEKRIGLFLIGFDGISYLTGQNIQQLRAGFRSEGSDSQFSSFFPEFSGRDRYPIEKELEVFGVDPSEIASVLDRSFDFYYKWRGENNDGLFPKFLEKTYRKYFTKDNLDQMKKGILGETCSVLANFMPVCLYTSFMMPVRENKFSDLLMALLADPTPEAVVIVDMLADEVKKVGYSLDDHLNLSEWRSFGYKYLVREGFEVKDFYSLSEQAVRFLGYSCNLQNTSEWLKYLRQLSEKRRKEDPLPENFKHINVGFARLTTFAAWCAVQRATLLSAYRTPLLPFNSNSDNFYSYEGRPSPDGLNEDFRKLHSLNWEIHGLMKEKNVPVVMQEMVMALGNKVGVQAFGNLRQWEAVLERETKHYNAHEIRRFFRGCANSLLSAYAWLKSPTLLFRVDLTEEYLFPHTDTPMLMPDFKEGSK